MESYEVSVKDGRFGKSYRYKPQLRSLGLHYSGRGSRWDGNFSYNGNSKIADVRSFCRTHGLHCEVKNNNFKRNNSYRADFFRAYRPAWHNRYFCIYCGKLLPVSKVTVDHIIPVQAALSNVSVQRYIGRRGWKDENNPENLGASCRKCNSKKGKKMGLWVLRGRVGKSNAFQWVRWVFRISIILLAIICTARFRSAATCL